MELDKLFDSFEMLCLKIIIDLILLPKTILKLYKDHTFSYHYSTSLLMQDGQFDKYTSPIKLTLYTVILICLLPEQLGGFAILQSQLFETMGILEKALLLFVVVNLQPILLSVAILCFNKTEITAQSVKLPLYAFIYSYSYIYLPIFICFIPVTIIDRLEGHHIYKDMFSSFTIPVVIFVFGVVLGYSIVQFCKALHFSVCYCLKPEKMASAFLITLAMVVLNMTGMVMIGIFLL